jgi:hypothetical protein
MGFACSSFCVQQNIFFNLKRFMEHSTLGGEYIPFEELKSIVELVVKETPPSSVSPSWAPIAAAAADCSSNSWC